MKLLFKAFLILLWSLSSSYAEMDSSYVPSKNCETKEIAAVPYYDCRGFLDIYEEENPDPLEPINRATFWINMGIDYLIIEPIAGAYQELVPEEIRTRVGYMLRNLSEPIVLTNNLLQGDLEDARTTIWRFLFNSTLGVAGIFDVSTDLGLPYKKEDLGLTFASWGIEPGPYLVLPILGPSNVRDAWGRLGDYVIDPINWWTLAIHSTSRTTVQILDAKTDNLAITDNIKKNSIDYYASIRSWYTERRKDLMIKKEDREVLDSPRPDDDEETPDYSYPDTDE